MRIPALDHGTKCAGVAVSDEMKLIASPLEYIPAEPFADFLVKLGNGSVPNLDNMVCLTPGFREKELAPTLVGARATSPPEFLSPGPFESAGQ